MKKLMSLGLFASLCFSAAQADTIDSTAGLYLKIDLGKQYNSFTPSTRFGINIGYVNQEPAFHDLDQTSSLAPMVEMEFSSNGIETMTLNGAPIMTRVYQLNEEEGAEATPSSYTTFDLVGIVAAIGAAVTVAENIGNGSSSSNGGGGGGGGGGGNLPVNAPVPCTPPLMPPACDPTL